MTYQYRTEQVRGGADKTLNDRAAEGWELVQVVQRGATAVLYLKREKPVIEKFKAATPHPLAGVIKNRGRPRGSKNKAKP